MLRTPVFKCLQIGAVLLLVLAFTLGAAAGVLDFNASVVQITELPDIGED